MTTADPTSIVAELTVAEAASLLSGADFASTKALPEHRIRSVTMTDGSNGVAMNLPDWSGKVPATCFPTSSAMAQTWDPELVGRVAAEIAREARAAGADVLLSPGMNIKRSPLGGRNFEYYSEDPLLTGELATAFVLGVQSEGLGACVKHYVANNQETDRMRVSAEVSERALREIYLAAFERVVSHARPWLVMASYNRVNGCYVVEDRRLLTGILRGEWGFDGVVVSDWGAVEDRVRALAAGLDLEMPSTSGASDTQVVDAVHSGRVSEADLRRSAARMVGLADRATSAPPATPPDAGRAAALATDAARRAAVLLRNEDAVLPLRAGQGIAVIGPLAERPRIQGGGSAGVNAPEPGSVVDALRVRHDGTVDFAQGSGEEVADAGLLEAALETAAAADIAVLVVGPPESAESEGYDRVRLELPGAQVELIRRVAAVADRTVVVVVSGGVVTMEPWRAEVDAILTTGLAGQGVSDALADLLTGIVEPTGRLAETIPLALEHTPSHLSFPGEGGRSFYGEGVFVGYRGYDAVGAEVAFPFGHGLGYTSFAYRDPRVAHVDGGFVASVVVENTGTRPGREVVQVYVEPPAAPVARPRRTLAGFASVELPPGGSARIDVVVRRRALERWDERGAGWATDDGAHRFAFGASARDLRAVVELALEGHVPEPALTRDSTLVEWLDHPVAGPQLLERVAAADRVGSTIGMLSSPTVRLMVGGLPIHRLAVDAGNVLTDEMLEEIRTRLDD